MQYAIPNHNADAARNLFDMLDQIHLVAIHPDRKNAIPIGKDFATDIDAAINWSITQNANGWNIYWTVNRVLDGLHKKPTKADIVGTRFVHVDIDPPKGNQAVFDKGAVALELALLDTAPSFVIDSGNGLQAFWRLAEDSPQADIEAVNIALRDMFEADNCQNIDRLMRVPGFVNFPDEKKRQRGRIPCLSGWYPGSEDDGSVHTLDELRAAFPSKLARGVEAQKLPKKSLIRLPVNKDELLTADDLPLAQVDKLRELIEHPKNPDRSKATFAFACEALRQNISPDQIAAVLLNPANAISAHCLDQHNPSRAAQRAIERAQRSVVADASAVSVTAKISWPEPVDLWGRFPPPVLPKGLLPDLIERWAFEQAESMGADPAGLAMAAIASCAAAIPDHLRVKVKRHADWYESARIWVALIGPPSAKKSPIIRAATAPINAIDTELFRSWQRAMARWLALEPDEKKGKPAPAQSRIRLTDTTVEAAQEVLVGSPNGLLMVQDELTGFFGSMDRYGSSGKGGADRAFWLQSWNGGEYALNRVGRGSTLIPNLSVSLLGGIQPEPFRKAASGMIDDGLIQRLFPIMLGRASMGKDEPMSDSDVQYGILIEALHKLRSPKGLNDGSLRLSDGAQCVRLEMEKRHLELRELESINRKLASHIGKYEGYFARLCVVWHCIEYCSDPFVDHDPNGLPIEISEGTAQRVADFMHQFLLPHAIAFYAECLGLSSDHDALESIAGYILTHKLTEVTNRDVQRGDRVMRKLNDFEVKPLLEQLEAMGWLERIEGPRPSSKPHFLVNPRVHEVFAAQAALETERRGKVREMIAQAVRG